MRKPKLMAFLIATLAVIGAACGGGGGDGDTTRIVTEATPTPTPATLAKATPPAGGTTPAVTLAEDLSPDFDIPLYKGEEVIGTPIFTLSQFFGRPILLNFWGALCPPCRAEMPDLQRTFETYRDQGLLVIGVDVGEITGLGSQEQGKEFLEEINVTYPTGPAGADVFTDYGVLGMPTSIFIRRDGSISKKWTGALPAAKLDELTQEILK